MSVVVRGNSHAIVRVYMTFSKTKELPFMRLRIKKGRKGVKKGRKMIVIFVIQYPDENVGNNG